MDAGLEGLRVEARRPSRMLFQIAGRNEADVVSGRGMAVKPRCSKGGAQPSNCVKLSKTPEKCQAARQPGCAVTGWALGRGWRSQISALGSCTDHECGH